MNKQDIENVYTLKKELDRAVRNLERLKMHDRHGLLLHGVMGNTLFELTKEEKGILKDHYHKRIQQLEKELENL